MTTFCGGSPWRGAFREECFLRAWVLGRGGWGRGDWKGEVVEKRGVGGASRNGIECGPMAKSSKPLQAAPTCQPFSKILVSAFAPGTVPETVTCTSNKAFLVYCSTNFSTK